MKSDQAAEGSAPTSPEEKAALAGALLDSLDQEVNQDAEAAWEVEIDRRLRDLDSGAVRPIPWSEARLKTSGR
jgi:putative addiction module component (TIGR02574 family)